MKREWLNEKSSSDDLRELDTLVLAEIESLTRCTRPLHPRRAMASDPRRQPETKPDKRREPVPLSKVTRIRGEERENEALSGEEAELLFDEDNELGDLSDVEEDEHGAAASLFSPEEEAFITRAVGFLAQRDNADMILNRIWEQLTEADPEGFFRPEDAERPASPGADAKPAPAGDAAPGSSGT